VVGHALLDKLIHYHPARAMAFIAVDEKNRKMLGVVRLHDDTRGENAEFAILVRSRLKGHGVGWLLMKRMIAFSRHKNLKLTWRTSTSQYGSATNTMLGAASLSG
jgi:acetyltransferase